MLRATAFPAPNNSTVILSRNHTCPYLEPTRVIFPRSSFISRLQFRRTSVKSLLTVHGGGFIPAAAKKEVRGSTSIVDEIEEEFDEEGEYEEEEGEEDEEVDVEEEEIVGYDEMKEWWEKKPKGFGEGKVYDTSVEDKLFEEMQKSKQAQALNLKKLKTNPIKNNVTKKIDEIVVPVRSRVRLVNLPKKRKIDRDLKSAFQGIPGITNIVPAVIGNKKTRDPVCKGFAFVDFKHEDDAIRFVELYTGQTITFGKIQKPIKCELVNAQSSSPPGLNQNINTALPLLPSFEEDSNEDSNIDDSAFNTWDETEVDDSDELQESDGESQEFATVLTVDSDDSVQMTNGSEIESLLSKQVDRKPSADKKSAVNVKQENAPKKKSNQKENTKKVLDVPGSAKRLKIKEKAVLSDVFSKYGSKAALASKES
ncbi:uncharacterized protein [Medicago truncatula]|uniref:RNA recognition motif n=1 Tax=Medicago truncatula TaxID=3880 RepID=G7K2V9_MEDTR|nr:uncharacterized protein LOC11412841 [Medicago truncatula]AES96285.1 RNA recognition motif [Medicago truncatula]